MPTSLLLIQARAPHDPVAEHERRCIERRLEGADAQLTARNAVAGAAEVGWLTGVDAVVIGGSGDFSVNHPRSASWVDPLRRLLDAIIEQATPTFGICFGHQLLGLHLGSRVETHADLQEAGTITLQRTPGGDGCALLSTLPASFPAHTGHSDHVASLPPGVELLACGERVELQAFALRGAPVFTTQFHPDLTGAEARERYLSVFQGKAVPDDVVLAKAAGFRTAGHDHAAVLLQRFVELYGVTRRAR